MSAKRFRTVWFSRLAALALLAGVASQAGESYLAKGMYEANFGLSYTNLDVNASMDMGGFDIGMDMDLDMFTGMADLSYFLTDELSLGIGVTGAYMDMQGSADVNGVEVGEMDEDGYMVGAELKLRYHFPAVSCMVPYVGIHGGYVYMDMGGDSEDGWSYGVHGGVKWPITANVFFDTQLRYTWVEVDDMDMDMLQLVAGISYYFGEGANVQFGASAEPGPYEAGDMELSFSGSYSYAKMMDDDAADESVDGHTFFAMGKASYFVTGEVAVGLGVTGMYMPDESDMPEDILLVGLEVSADYNFSGLGRIVPYVGIHGGYAYAEAGGMEYLWSYGAHGGAKYLLTDSVFVDAQLRYTEYDYSNDDVDADIEAIQVMFGLGFRL